MYRHKGFRIEVRANGEDLDGYAIYDPHKDKIFTYPNIELMARDHAERCKAEADLDSRLDFSASETDGKDSSGRVVVVLKPMDPVDTEEFGRHLADAFHGIS